MHIEEIYEYDLNSTAEQLDKYCQKADFVFNLAGVNRPENPEDFMKGNFGFASALLNCLKKSTTIRRPSCCLPPSRQHWQDVSATASMVAAKGGRGAVLRLRQEDRGKGCRYRFVNLMGHSRPKYNSAVSTFCWAVANDEPFTVNDRSTELELLYIDDLWKECLTCWKAKSSTVSLMAWKLF